MFTSTNYHGLLHITNDGKVTLCGRGCRDWHQDNEGMTDNSLQSECHRCGDPQAFESHKAELRKAYEEREAQRRVEETERRRRFGEAVAAGHMLAGDIKAMFEQAGHEVMEIRRLPAGFDLQVKSISTNYQFKVKVSCTVGG